MPVLMQPLANTYQSITRRIVKSITFDLLKYIGIKRDVVILFKGESKQTTLWNHMTHQLEKPDKDTLQISGRAKLTIEIEDVASSEALARGAMTLDQYPPIWASPGGVRLIPQYIGHELTLNYSYETESVEESEWFKTRITELMVQFRTQRLMDIDYRIIPNQGIMEILNHTYQLESQVDTYQDFKDYLYQNAMDNSILKIGNKLNEHYSIGFKEKQEAYGIMQNNEVPQANERDVSYGHRFDFSYLIYYDKPINTLLKFPVTIFNQMVDSRFVPGLMWRTMEDRFKDKASSMHLKGLNNVLRFVNQQGMTYTAQRGVIVPIGDDWQPKEIFGHVHPIFTGLIPIKPNKERRLLGKLSLYREYITFHNSMLEWFFRFPEKLTHPYHSPVSFQFWVNQTQIDRKWIEVVVDEEKQDIRFYTKYPMTIRDTCHVKIGLLTDFHHCDDVFFAAMQDHTILSTMIARRAGGKLSGNRDIDAVIREALVSNAWRRLKLSDQEVYLEEVVRKAIIGELIYTNKGLCWKILPAMILGHTYKYQEKIQPHFEQWYNHISQGSNLIPWASTRNNFNLRWTILSQYVVALYEAIQKGDIDLPQFKSRGSFYGVIERSSLRYRLNLGISTHFDELYYFPHPMRTVSQMHTTVHRKERN